MRPREEQPGFYGALAAAEYLGDLLQRHPLIIVEHNRLALRVAQVKNYPLEAVAQLRAFKIRLGDKHIVFLRQTVLVERVNVLIGARAPNQAAAVVSCDDEQPDVKCRRVCKLRELLPRGDKCVLRGVLCVMEVFEDGHTVGVNVLVAPACKAPQSNSYRLVGKASPFFEPYSMPAL